MHRDQGEQMTAPTVLRRKTRPVVRKRNATCPSRYSAAPPQARPRAPCRALAGVADRRLEAEGEEHDAGNHRQVEVAVGVQREPVQLEALACMSRLRARIAATSK